MKWRMKSEGVERCAESLDELKSWIAAGEVPSTARILHPQLGRWLPVSKVPELRRSRRQPAGTPPPSAATEAPAHLPPVVRGTESHARRLGGSVDLSESTILSTVRSLSLNCRCWCRSGRVQRHHYVHHPLFQKWMYASEAQELSGLFSPPPAPRMPAGEKFLDPYENARGCLRAVALLLLFGVLLFLLITSQCAV